MVKSKAFPVGPELTAGEFVVKAAGLFSIIVLGGWTVGVSLSSIVSVPLPSTSVTFFCSFGSLSVGVVGWCDAMGDSGGFWAPLGSPGGRIGEGGQGLWGEGRGEGIFGVVVGTEGI